MQQRVTRKWRPSLTLIIVGAMAGVVAVTIFGLLWIRVAGNILSAKEVALTIIALSITAALILGYLLWRLVLRPVTALTAHARAVKAGRAAPPPDHFGTPEFSQLGQSVIDMGDTLQNRAAGLRAYADHVTHELKSPLTAISGAAELLQDAQDEADRAALAQTILEASARMETLLGDLRRHAAAGQGRLDGNAKLSDVADTLSGPRIVIAQDGTIPMPADDLQAVLAQLAQNAAAHGATELALAWQASTLTVHDDGRGVAEGNRARIFDPFFTTTRAEGGTGMGLSIVRALVEAQGGKIALIPAQSGALFEISF